MVAGAFWNDLANGVIKIFSNINTRSGDTGNGSGGVGDLIKNLFSSDGGGSWGNTIKQTIQESLTVDNLNTVKDLLRTYWGDIKQHCVIKSSLRLISYPLILNVYTITYDVMYTNNLVHL